ncbi:MAG: N-acetylmuramic acid 6-phosphate etherase [Rhizobiaceae bacterium]|nr:N-acetylmuramic acid 6-phosphate etherase [Rhizobiaceae bacterium]
MAERRTETQHSKAQGLDLRAPEAVLRVLADGQTEAARAVVAAIPSIARAAEAVARALADGGRIAYAAAGSSGLMALADGLELPGTFGLARDRIVILLAGGAANFHELANGAEDDADLARSDVANARIGEGDCLIAVSASGTTPYALGALLEAGVRGATTVGIANNAGAPLFDLADVPVLIETPAEVIAGSTRMGAGTAQKIALNMMSTMMAIHLGHVHDGYMVNLRPDNVKLKDRAARIVAAIAGCAPETAAELLGRSGGSVKAAILMASGARDAADAERLLKSAGQRLRPALAMIEGSTGSNHSGAKTPKQGECK